MALLDDYGVWSYIDVLKNLGARFTECHIDLQKATKDLMIVFGENQTRLDRHSRILWN